MKQTEEQRIECFRAAVNQCWKDWSGLANDPARNNKRRWLLEAVATHLKPLGYSETRVRRCLAAVLCQKQMDEYEAESQQKPPVIRPRDYLQVETELQAAGVFAHDVLDLFRDSDNRPEISELFKPDQTVAEDPQ